jgi:hypothetical protein
LANAYGSMCGGRARWMGSALPSCRRQARQTIDQTPAIILADFWTKHLPLELSRGSSMLGIRVPDGAEQTGHIRIVHWRAGVAAPALPREFDHVTRHCAGSRGRTGPGDLWRFIFLVTKAVCACVCVCLCVCGGGGVGVCVCGGGHRQDIRRWSGQMPYSCAAARAVSTTHGAPQRAPEGV